MDIHVRAVICELWKKSELEAGDVQRDEHVPRVLCTCWVVALLVDALGLEWNLRVVVGR